MNGHARSHQFFVKQALRISEVSRKEQVKRCAILDLGVKRSRSAEGEQNFVAGLLLVEFYNFWQDILQVTGSGDVEFICIGQEAGEGEEECEEYSTPHHGL